MFNFLCSVKCFGYAIFVEDASVGLKIKKFDSGFLKFETLVTPGK